MPSRTEMQAEVVEFLERLADIAGGVQRSLAWLLIIGVIASIALAWKVYAPDSALWWNIVKCGLVMLPVLIWCFVWNILGQLRQAPELAAEMLDDDAIERQSLNLNANQNQPKPGIRALFGAIREFRQNEGFEVVFDTIGSVSLLANPLFAALAFVMFGLVLLFIFITPLIWFL